MRKLKIVGNFAVCGTKIIDEESGEEIRNVRKVSWTHQAGKTPVCEIELVGVSIAAIGEDFQDISSVDQTDPYRRYLKTAPATRWQRIRFWFQRLIGKLKANG